MQEGDIKDLLQSQQQFFKSSSKTSVKERISILKKLKSSIKAHEKEIVKAVYKDFQKPEFEVLTSELFVAYKELNLFIKKLKHWSKPKSVSSAWLNFPSSDKIYHVPWGKVLVIAPWNYPFQLAITPVIGAIASGNTVVLKPSEHAPYTADILEKIISEVFEAQQAKVIQGAVETAKLLLEQQWDYVFFTGSVTVGRIVSQQIAEHMTPHTLELGGKNPCIVDASANLDVAAKRICWGKFLNAGQTCIAPDYLLVDASIKAEFQEKLIFTLKTFYADGNFTDYARLIHEDHFERLTGLLKDQDIIYGGDSDPETNFLAPTLVESPDFSSSLMEEEIFGPILPLYSYSSFDELETTITTFDKPLSLYVFSERKDFIKRVNENFDFGGGVINDTIVHFVNDKLPFGGVGASGLGNYHGKASFETFTRKKSIVNRKTWLDIPIKYPPYTHVDSFKSFMNLFR
ncbi:aldehyde dehydrogenase [Psychroflexus sp. YR1-1]|uniref:Aldehyde dehydrogenase n=1 Tax=Psychroflexus aurantiacus TaxID=2709310 RepID=A0A6B3R2A3_9FLAO|nr:aldehyde dehydrogenase [Psychroflexus aurantiacus]NEV94178.1 aldehyde dehydrogenase [Psychroflexus aurantiacus]